MRGPRRLLGSGVCFLIGALGLLVPIGAGAVPEDIPKGQIEAEAAAAHELAEACARSACRTESRELRLK